LLTSFIDVAARAKHNNVIAGLCLVVAFFFATSRFDVSAQTTAASPTTAPAALSPEAVEAAEAMKRSRRQAENPYRWIKILGDSKRKPETVRLEPVKARTRSEPLNTETSKPEPRPSMATEPAPTTTVGSGSAGTPPEQAAGTAPPVTAAALATSVAPTAPPTAAAKAPPEDEADGELKPISTLPPEFPRELRNSVSTGRVTVAFTVQPNGTVGATSAEFSTNRRLEKAALDAVGKWKFEPIASAETYKVDINFNQ